MIDDISKSGLQVTPCMGVWIETLSGGDTGIGVDVTPCMGVWIETQIEAHFGVKPKSHPVWVCGLKR